jgi:glycyl-tRNA synthetase
MHLSQPPLTFQDVILTLQQFWSRQGCVLWQPYHTEVGAGTMNPATSLRVLGPEPWNVAYVEPVIRPADGRYGENPNRWQHYYQFQVILKPDPGNPQEIYLQSLVALGIEPAKHDIRFVEDNWASPALGAWGLGWEVWLDGQEITQYTYFQQAGGMALEPVSVEITYGLERILIALQDVDTFLDIRWNEALTYGQLQLQGEREYCGYNFETASVDRLRLLFGEYEAEAQACLEAGLVLPAHDYVLKCSHAFNLMDSRGAVGVADRAALFGRMRDLSHRVSEAYLEQRQAAEFPWQTQASKAAPAASSPVLSVPPPSKPAAFVLEIGTEELPAGDLDSALEQLRSAVPAMLESLRLGHGDVGVLGTPRRLAVLVDDLAPGQQEQVALVKGPPADRAFDAQGTPTAAAIGFAKGKGVPVDALQAREMDGGRYVVAEVRQPGRPAVEVLGAALAGLVAGLRFDMSMRWDESGVAFSRPIRWLVAVHGKSIVPFAYAGLTAGNRTRLMRFAGDETAEIRSADSYRTTLERTGIMLDSEARRALIRSQIEELAAGVGGAIPEADDLLSEVANLVEQPTSLVGAFDPSFLALPREVLVAVMRKHQRYFPVESGGKLLPHFIAVRNGGSQHLDSVTRGNEHVLRARFSDAAYFVRRDREHPLESFVPRLATMTFQERLGSVLDKVVRIERLTALLTRDLALDAAAAKVAARAAHLSKADLATQMVVEMTSLQGEVGRQYARADGEPEAVAEAIFEHYLPRHAGDRTASSLPGLLVGLADRLDSLMGLFSAGVQPTGARDPFALRRAAIGLVQNLVERGLRFDLRRGLRLAAEGLPIPTTEAAESECLAFIAGRQSGLLLADGHRHDVVEAVLAAQSFDPAGAAAGVAALERWVGRDDWDATLQSFARCVRITRSQPTPTAGLTEASLTERAEKDLAAALHTAEATRRGTGSVDDFLEAFRPMVPAVSRFFEDVLVMADDAGVRANRLALLHRIVALAEGVADVSKMEGF